MKKKLNKIYTIALIASFSYLTHSCSSEVLSEDVIANEKVTVLSKSSQNSSYMVIFQDEAIPNGFENASNGIGSIKKSINEIGVVVMESTDANFIKKVTKIAGVRSAVPDLDVQWIEPQNFTPEASPAGIGDNEPFFSLMWGLDAIDAPEAWNAGYTGESVRVAVLDSGIDAEHPDLSPNLNTELSASFISGEDWNIQPGFYFNHGTHVAGTIAAADNSFGVIGVAPNVELVAVKVLSEFTGSGPFSSINAGIVYATTIDADVVNMSLGATLNKNGKIPLADGSIVKIPAKFIAEIRIAQQRAIDYAYRNGVTIVVAAGNDGVNADGNASAVILPADMNNVVTVSATAPDYWAAYPNADLDIPASYTNYGRSLVDVSAPGGDFDFFPQDFWHYDMVLSTISNGWSWSAGTSMASPHVAGVAALIIGKNGGDMHPHDVAKQLMNTADKVDGNGNSLFHGNGRVNAFRAVTE